MLKQTVKQHLLYKLYTAEGCIFFMTILPLESKG